MTSSSTLENIVLAACESDDPTLIEEESIASVIPSGSEDRVDVLRKVVYHATLKRSLRVLQYALASVSTAEDKSLLLSSIGPAEVLTHGPPVSLHKNLVTLLQSHSWDIDKRTQKTPPLLWMVSSNTDLALWCVDRGASTDLQPIIDDSSHWPWYQSLLEELIRRHGSLALLQELRSRGAPLAPRCLHLAASRACSAHQTADSTTANLALLRHLIDTEQLDVNASDLPQVAIQGYRQKYFGSPLAYCVRAAGQGIPALKLLLARGADPTLKLGYAARIPGENSSRYSALDRARKGSDTHEFINVVEAFAEQHRVTIAAKWAGTV